jgi:hypothetical protein
MNINKLKKLVSEEAIRQIYKKVLTESSKILPDSFVEQKKDEEEQESVEDEEKDTDDDLTAQMKTLLDTPAFMTALKQKLGL